jgi:hypothetical protein
MLGERSRSRDTVDHDLCHLYVLELFQFVMPQELKCINMRKQKKSLKLGL